MSDINPKTRDEVLSVSELNRRTAKLLENTIPILWVAGEVSNATRAASGHWYFSLKDAGAQVRCIMLKSRAQYIEPLQDGDKVEVRALVSLYQARGEFQLNVENVRHQGQGDLHAAFVRLKNKLQLEGLFDAEKKRQVPKMPRAVGIVTSLQAAALADVLATLRRRSPHVKVRIYPTPVQGAGAAAQIARAITLANARAMQDELDVLIVCRGGGSLEDLWQFNEEVVARAIAASTLPVVSAVGHETDFSISDFVADVRAATPTAAAELVAQAQSQALQLVQNRAQQLQRAQQRTLLQAAQRLDYAHKLLPTPSQQVQRAKLKVQHSQQRFQTTVVRQIASYVEVLNRAEQSLQRLLPNTQALKAHVLNQQQRLQRTQKGYLEAHVANLALARTKLDLLNPRTILQRGYAIVSTEKGEIVKSPKQFSTGDILNFELAQGNARIKIASTK